MEYLLLLYDDEARAAAQSQQALAAQIEAYRRCTAALKNAGVLRSGNALHPSSTATTLQVRGGKTATLDGPFAETKEQLVGYYLIDCADLDTALAWAAEMPAAATGRVEVRPIWNY